MLTELNFRTSFLSRIESDSKVFKLQLNVEASLIVSFSWDSFQVAWKRRVGVDAPASR